MFRVELFYTSVLKNILHYRDGNRALCMKWNDKHHLCSGSFIHFMTHLKDFQFHV